MSREPKRQSLPDDDNVREEFIEKLEELCELFGNLMHDKTEAYIEMFMYAAEMLPDEDGDE